MSDILKRLEHKISALDHDLDGDLVEDLNSAYDAIEARDKRIEEQSEIIERQNIIINELRMLNAFEAVLEKGDE